MNSVHRQKWSKQEDALLLEAVEKYGTQWVHVLKYIKNIRTINSVVKRWHGKLKLSSEGKKIQQILDERQRQGNDLESQNEEKNNEGNNNSQSQQSDNNQSNYKWKRVWKEEDDFKLKNLLVKEGVLDWKKIAAIFYTDSKQVKNRWTKIVCKTIMQPSKIGGALKWSDGEDAILTFGVKSNISWSQISVYLPNRTQYSIEARWRRIAKCVQTEQPDIKNKHLFRKQVLIKIANKKKIKMDSKEDAIEQEKS